MKTHLSSNSVLYAFVLFAIGCEASPAVDVKDAALHHKWGMGWHHHHHGNSSRGWPHHHFHNSTAAAGFNVPTLGASSLATTVVTAVSAAAATQVSPVTDTCETVKAISTNPTVLEHTSAVLSSRASSAAAVISTIATSSSTLSSVGSTASPLPFKAGLSGYEGITSQQAFKDLNPYISWYSDYWPNTADANGVKGIAMLWGDGTSCSSNSDDSDRLTAFDDLATAPEFMFGFYEPDCSCPMSSQMSETEGASLWNQKLAPLAANGTILGSPSMCKQFDETWLTPFSVDATTGKSLLDAPWTYTSVHINKNSLDGVKADVGYYWMKYGKPIWVSEFACVDDSNGFTPCTDQTEINQFISDAVDFFQSNASVIAFGASNGEGLGTTWPLIDSSTGELTTTGTTYLNKLKSLQ